MLKHCLLDIVVVIAAATDRGIGGLQLVSLEPSLFPSIFHIPNKTHCQIKMGGKNFDSLSSVNWVMTYWVNSRRNQTLEVERFELLFRIQVVKRLIWRLVRARVKLDFSRTPPWQFTIALWSMQRERERKRFHAFKMM